MPLQPLFRHLLSRYLLRHLPLVLLIAWVAAASEPAQWPISRADQSTPACLISGNGERIPLRLEIADTPESRSTGLMHREHLPPDAGMLFIFSATRPGHAGFWMYNTLIPLDIAFLDEEGRILRILGMVPCPHRTPSRCRSYSPNVSYTKALETNAGFFVRHGLQPGDRLQVGDECRPEASPPGH